MSRQLQVEFPDEHMRKYWLDSNVDMSPAELGFDTEGRIRCHKNERGWHYTRKYKDGEQFPIELEWRWHEA